MTEKQITPPTPVPGMDLRTWLAGCAFANPNVVTSADPETAAIQATQAVDALMRALKNKVPTNDSLKPPTSEKLEKLEGDLKQRKQDTIPAKKIFTGVTEDLKKASKTNVQAIKPQGRYSIYGG